VPSAVWIEVLPSGLEVLDIEAETVEVLDIEAETVVVVDIEAENNHTIVHIQLGFEVLPSGLEGLVDIEQN
jgi:hypothetical protein